jgi:hypothetical protein
MNRRKCGVVQRRRFRPCNASVQPERTESEEHMSDVNEHSAATNCYPSCGAATGLYDSNGQPIHVGDKVKRKVNGNTDYHGEWAIYEVVVRGMIPVLMYVTSEKGDRFPRGYTGCALSEQYDAKMFLWGSDLADVRPYDEMTVFDG